MAQARKYESAAARQAAYRLRQEQARSAQLQERGLPSLPVLPSLPGYPRWNAALMRAVEHLRLVHVEMSDYFEARSQRWQESERGEEHLERVSTLEEVLASVEELRW